jgi:hypothetical protein
MRQLSWAVQLLVSSLLLVTPASLHAEDAQTAALLCKPQGLLKLTAPFSPPRATGGLAWCSEYGACSCCEHQHVALAYNSLRAVLADPEFSPKCTAFLTKLACRICDPLVGTGQRPNVCLSYCDGFYSACADEYFAFHPTSGMLTPCATAGQQPALVCSRGRDLAASPAELCSLSGSLPGDDASLCWSGGDTPAVLDSCKADRGRARDAARSSAAGSGDKAAAGAKKGAKKRKRKQAKARNKRAAGAKYSFADLVLLGVVCVGSLWAGLQLLSSSGMLARMTTSSDEQFPGNGQRLGSGAPRTAKHKPSFGIAND